MHAELEILLEMQDLQEQRRALAAGPVRGMEAEVFELEIDGALRLLDEKITELEGRLSPSVHAGYARIAGGATRVVVPVLNGTCYGCFMAVPTSWSAEAGRNDHVRTCQNCGRFLYYVQ